MERFIGSPSRDIKDSGEDDMNNQITHSNRVNGCQIWRGYDGVGFSDSRTGEILVDQSARADGRYAITQCATWAIRDGGFFDDYHKARLTTMLVDQRRLGVTWPRVTSDTIERARHLPPLSVQERAIRLLRFIESQCTTVTTEVQILQESHAAYAWSESVSWDEIVYFLDYLQQLGLIQGRRSGERWFIGGLSIAGYGELAKQNVAVDSSQAFVAMWFDSSMNDVYEKGFKLGIEDAKYKPFRIDRKEHINKIDDEIIAEIRRSRFLVADFTQGSDGARGGVYYEAGFAHGHALPAIFSCRQDAVETLHFDTNHYNHIVWSTPQELRDKLKIRILAIMGEGPEANINP